MNNWTNEYPTESGFYWFVGKVNKYHPFICDTPTIIEVWYSEEYNERDYAFCGTEIVYYDEHLIGIFSKTVEPSMPYKASV